MPLDSAWSAAEGRAFPPSANRPSSPPLSSTPPHTPFPHAPFLQDPLRRATIFPPPNPPFSHLLTTAFDPPHVFWLIPEPQPLPFAASGPLPEQQA